MTEKKSYIPSRLKNASVDGHVAGAEDIYDDALNKTQEEINAIVLTPSSGIDDRLKTIEQGVAFEGTIETETNPENVVSPGAKVPTTNAVRGAIDVRTGYFTCSTGGSTAAKTATAPGYVLTRGGAMRIWMEHANTADNATLNINSTGAKALFYNGERAGSDNSWEDEEVITVYYDETANSNAGAYYASNAQGGGGKAEKIKYDNAQSGLAAVNVQGAVDEVAGSTYVYEKVDFTPVNGTSVNFWFNDDGWSGGNRHSYVIPRDPSWKKMDVKSNSSALDARWAFLDNTYTSPVAGSKTSIISIGYAAGQGTVVNNIMIPDDCAYIAFGASPSSTTGIDFLAEYIYMYVRKDVKDVNSKADTSLSALSIVRPFEEFSLTGNNNTSVSHQISGLVAGKQYRLRIVSDSFPTSNLSNYANIYGLAYTIDSAVKWVFITYKGINEIPNTYTFRAIEADSYIVQIRANKNAVVDFLIEELDESYLSEGSAGNDLYSLKVNVEDINDELYGNAVTVTEGLDDADVAYVKSSSPTVTETTVLTDAFRIRLIYPVPKGTVFSVRCTLYDGVVVGLYSTRSQCIINGLDYIELYSDTYTTERISGITSAEGYLDISWKNENGDNFTQEDYDAFMSNVEVSILYKEGVDPADSINGRIEALEGATLPIPHVVQGCYVAGNNTNTEGGVGDTTRTDLCVTNSICILPYNGAKLHVVLPDNIGCHFKIQNGATVKYSISEFHVNGDVISCPATHNAYVIVFCYISGKTQTGAAIDPSAVNKLIDSGQIKFWYEEKEGDTIQRTAAEDTYIKAVTDCWDGSYSTQYANIYPILAHVSDLHGDSVRLRNALEWSEYKGVDTVINTGDNVCLSKQSGLEYVADTGSLYKVNQIQAVGNHDAKGDDTYRADSNSELYNKLISPFIATSGYSMPSSSQYDGEPTYYYKDFSKKLRVIVLNQYEQGAKNAYNNGRISQKQIDWFIDVLANTPQNYGVVLAYHALFKRVNKVNGYDSFFETLYSDDYPRDSSLAGIVTEPVTRIIDAFISKGSTSFSYTNLLLDNTTETVSVSADFTSLNSGVEFIAHLFGHIHQDTVGYYNDTTNTQLAIGINSSVALYDTSGTTALANPQDVPRGGKGINQDCFNVYCIDRDRKVVRIAKVGSNMTVELNKRDYMSIPYAD